MWKYKNMRNFRQDQEGMPWYYWVIAVVIMLVITYVGLYLAGEVQSPMDFLLNLKKRGV